MNRPKILLYALGILVLSTGIIWAGSLSLTTYYPAPQGYYNSLYAQTNLGIGTTSVSPNRLLEVTGNGGTGAAPTFAGVRFSSINAAEGGTPLINYGEWTQNYNGTTLGYNYNFNLMDHDTAPGAIVTPLIIAPSGNVGIGTLSVGMPSLSGTAASTIFKTNAGSLGATAGTDLALGSIGFTSTNESSLGIHAYRTSAGSTWTTTAIGIGMDVDDTTRKGANLWLNENGNVGIGITTPTEAPLQFASTSPANKLVLYSNGPGSDYGFGISDANLNAFFPTGAGYRFSIRQNSSTGTEEAMIDSSGNAYFAGNVGIGLTSSTTAPADNLYINPVGTTATMLLEPQTWGTIADSAELIMGDTNHTITSTWGTGTTINDVNGISLTGSNVGIDAGPSTSYNLYVNGTTDLTGNVAIGGTLTVTGAILGLNCITGTTCSDQRLKQNIAPLEDTLSKLDQLRGVSYEWNHLATSMGLKEGQKSDGMIAQELQKVYPELVGSIKKGHEEYLTIDYGKFTAVLLQSIKELKAQVNTMQDQINTLQAKVKTLEKQK